MLLVVNNFLFFFSFFFNLKIKGWFFNLNFIENFKACKLAGGWSDDSDFTDSEEEDDRLCNTMLVTGPHGVGKTASVYALAQEMGYKVS